MPGSPAVGAVTRFHNTLGGVAACVDDAVSLQCREGDGDVEGADHVAFLVLSHGRLFSVAEHMFVRYGGGRTATAWSPRSPAEPVFLGFGLKSGLQTTPSRSIASP
jgi:hypothetical protein